MRIYFSRTLKLKKLTKNFTIDKNEENFEMCMQIQFDLKKNHEFEYSQI